MMTEQTARKKAKILKQKLGKGWHIHIHENLGWHYCAVKNEIQVYPNSCGKYWCMISGRIGEANSGSCCWTKSETKLFVNPRQAVRDAVKEVAEHKKLVDTIYKHGMQVVLEL